MFMFDSVYAAMSKKFVLLRHEHMTVSTLLLDVRGCSKMKETPI